MLYIWSLYVCTTKQPPRDSTYVPMYTSSYLVVCGFCAHFSATFPGDRLFVCICVLDMALAVYTPLGHILFTMKPKSIYLWQSICPACFARAAPCAV